MAAGRLPDGPVRGHEMLPDGPRRGPARLRISPEDQLALIAEAVVELADALVAAAPAGAAAGKKAAAGATPALDVVRQIVNRRWVERDGGG